MISIHFCVYFKEYYQVKSNAIFVQHFGFNIYSYYIKYWFQFRKMGEWGWCSVPDVLKGTRYCALSESPFVFLNK